MSTKPTNLKTNLHRLFRKLIPRSARQVSTLNARCTILFLLVLLFTIEQLIPLNVFAQTPSSAERYSRFLTDPYEEYSFAEIEAKVAKIRSEGHAIPTGHPRIFITPSKRAALKQKIQQHYLDEMNALVAVADAAYGTTFTDTKAAAQPVILIEALIYQLGEIPGVNLSHTPEQYGKDAVRHLTSNTMINSYYKHLEYLALPLGYDWLYDLMTPAQRQVIATKMLQTAFPESKQIFDWNNPPGGRLLGALAIKGDPGVDQAQVNLALDDFYTGMVFGDPADTDMVKISQDNNLTLNHIFNAGGPGSEGMIYSTSWRPIYPFLLAWRDQTGEDYFKLPLFQNWPLHFTHSTGNEYEHQDKFAYSANDPWKQGGTRYTGVFTYLEVGLLQSNRDMSALMKYHRRTYAPNASQQLIYMLLSDPTLNMKSPKELDLAKTAHFDVVNSVFSRNSWEGIDSTWLMFQSPTWTNIRDLGPLNDLNIWKHGGMLLTKHEQAHDYDGGNRTNTLLLYDESTPGVTYIPQNVMDRAGNRWLGLSFKNGASIKQLSKDLPTYHEGLRYFEDEPEKYLYALGDGGQTFGSVAPTGTVESPPRTVDLDGWSRQLIWFRADSNDNPDHFIVMDRIKKDRNTLKEHLRFNFNMNPQIRNRRTNQNLGSGSKEFEGKWNYTNADRIVVTNTVKTGWGTAHGRLFIDTLLPHQTNYYRMGGVNERNIDVFGNLRTSALEVKGDPNSVKNILKGMWRVQVEPKVNNLENTYLHVMQATDASVENPDDAILIESADLIGTAVANNMALFSPTETEIVNNSVVLPAGVSGTYRLLIADLSPSTAYSVVIGGTRYNKVASMAGTIYLENIRLESGRSISISSDANGSPIARFTADPTTGEAPSLVSFNASTSHDADGSITSYTWNFGDGSNGNGRTVSHTYANAGTYTVKLTVKDNDGNTSSTTKTIQVTPPAVVPPTASFTANVTSGEAPLVVGFNASGSSDSDGSITGYAWNFGDGSNGNGRTASHTYTKAGTYIVKLTVTDNDGNISSTTKTIQVTPPAIVPPTASFTANVTSGEAPLVVGFNASGSSDSDGNIVDYTWNFGDGSNGNGRTVSHTYTDAGTYTAMLTVRDNDGETSSATKVIQVKPATVVPPKANFIVDTISGEAPVTVNCDASSSVDSDGKIVSYSWDFGDGAKGNGVKVSHTCDEAGTFTVTLTVTDDDGMSDSSSRTIVVTEPKDTITTFPVKLTGKNLPEEATVSLDVEKPSVTGETATLTLMVFDPDHAREGALRINGHGPIVLFGKLARYKYNGKTVAIPLTTPTEWWQNGPNTLQFVHTSTGGFYIKSATVEFQNGDGSPTTFPVSLKGKNLPEEATVNLRVSKPSLASGTAALTMMVFDPDIAKEGTLEINGHEPITLFGNLARFKYDRKTVPITFNTPADWWKDGLNTLRFVHAKTGGYVIENASVSFEISKSADDLVVSNLQADTINTAKPYEFFDLEVGARMYTDRVYKFVTLPDTFSGHKAIRTGNNDKASETSNSDFLTFDVHQDVNIYIIYTNFHSTIEQDWLNDANGWNLVDYEIVTNLSGPEAKRLVRKKLFRKGSVKLSGNGASSSMYNVVIVPASHESKVAVAKVKAALSSHDSVVTAEASKSENAAGSLDFDNPDYPGTPVSWTVYEDGEDTTIARWNQYNGGVVKNIDGGVDGSGRAIEVSGDIESDVFRLGQKDGSDWDNDKESFAEFSMALEEPGSGAIYFQVETNAGIKYLVYTDNGTVESQDPDLIYVSLEDIADGKWHKIFRDLEGDLKTVHPDSQLRSVKGLFVYGSAKLDDIKLLDFATGQIN